MYLTLYNFLMSLLWSSLFFGAFCFLCRKISFIRAHGVLPLMGLFLLGSFRSCLTFELPFTKVIPSYRLLPAIQQAVREPFGALHLSFRDLFVLVWMLVALLLLIRLALQISQQNEAVLHLRQHTVPAATAMAEALCQEAGISRRCAAVVLPGLDSPAVYGFFSPTVLLPDMEFSEEQLRYILLHELSHFRNHDAWLKLFTSVFKALFWWNPLVYLLDKNLDYALELRCDACATDRLSQEQKIEYGEAVLDLVKRRQALRTDRPDLVFSLDGRLSRKVISSRMELVFSPNMLRKKLSPLLAAAVVLILLLSYSFVIQPSGGLPPEEDLVGTFEPDFENAYILHTAEDNYELYVEGELFLHLNDDLLHSSPINEIEIIEENIP